MSLWKRGRQYWTDFTVAGRRYRKRLRTTNLRTATRRERELVEEAGHGRWRALADHVHNLPERQHPVGRALTAEERKRLFYAAASNPEWEHVYCAAIVAANTSMRPVEVKHLRRPPAHGHHRAGRDGRGRSRARIDQRSPVAPDAGALLPHQDRREAPSPGCAGRPAPKQRRRKRQRKAGERRGNRDYRRGRRRPHVTVTSQFAFAGFAALR